MPKVKSDPTPAPTPARSALAEATARLQTAMMAVLATMRAILDSGKVVLPERAFEAYILPDVTARQRGTGKVAKVETFRARVPRLNAKGHGSRATATSAVPVGFPVSMLLAVTPEEMAAAMADAILRLSCSDSQSKAARAILRLAKPKGGKAHVIAVFDGAWQTILPTVTAACTVPDALLEAFAPAEEVRRVAVSCLKASDLPTGKSGTCLKSVSVPVGQMVHFAPGGLYSACPSCGSPLVYAANGEDWMPPAAADQTPDTNADQPDTDTDTADQPAAPVAPAA